MHRFRLLLVAVLLLAAGCRVNPSTGRSQLLLISSEDAIALGNESKPALMAEYGGEVDAPELRSYVALVGRSMAELTEADYPQLPWEFTVLDSDVINAFALPGGKVFASKGLLERLDNEAQLAGVLGHEVGPVPAAHAEERISHSLLVAGVAIGATAAAGQSDDDWVRIGVPVIVGAAGTGYLLSFNRDQEQEADEQGVKYMTAAGYDPHGMLEVLHVLADAGSGPRPPEFLSTHPYPETRMKTVRDLLDGPYHYTQGSPDFRKYRKRYEREARPFLPADVPDQAAITGQGAVLWCGLCRAKAAP
ncbi:MAG: M48 family metalloprotease [Planctomycetota bacterium]|jgi:predicted Zn-dependent protease